MQVWPINRVIPTPLSSLQLDTGAGAGHAVPPPASPAPGWRRDPAGTAALLPASVSPAAGRRLCSAGRCTALFIGGYKVHGSVLAEGTP